MGISAIYDKNYSIEIVKLASDFLQSTEDACSEMMPGNMCSTLKISSLDAIYYNFLLDFSIHDIYK